MIKHPRKIFLIDAAGASFTAFFLGVILMKFQNFFGMPHNALIPLSLFACIYAVYSFGCFFMKVSNWRPFLRVIAIANVLYCSLTLILIICYYEQLTPFGILYFLLEIGVIAVLIIFEFRVISKG